MGIQNTVRAYAPDAAKDSPGDEGGSPQHDASSAAVASTVALTDREGVLLSEDAARSVFEELRNDPDFLWEYIEDCCLARAHKMCAILTGKGIASEKIRVDNADGTWLGSFGLSTPRKDAPGAYIHMSFHIAPVVKVHTPDGIAERVLDPALCEAPATPQEWSGKLINRHGIRADGSVDENLQEKTHTRLAHDVFEAVLFWTNKDEHMKTTNELLTKHRNDFERMNKK